MPSDLERDLDLRIKLLVSPRGHAADRREHDRALAYLLEHADAAHPRLLALLDPDAPLAAVAAIHALPLFGRADSIPKLEELLVRGTETARLAAGEALGRHPHAKAAEALFRALRHPRDEVVAAAADGLLTRGDPAACPRLREALHHRDPVARYHVAQAAGRLGCLDRDTLETFAANDPDEDIRGLARELLSPVGRV